MMDYRQLSQFFPNSGSPGSLPGAGFHGGGFPGFPGGFPGGGTDRRVERLEREVERLEREVNRLDRRLERVERRFGFSAQRDF